MKTVEPQSDEENAKISFSLTLKLQGVPINMGIQ